MIVVSVMAKCDNMKVIFVLFFLQVSANSKNFRLSDLDMHSRVQHSHKSLLLKSINTVELTSEYWLESAKKSVSEKVSSQPNINKAKNVILFVGDGMSHTTIAAARVAMGGEEKKLIFENFPHTASSRTYCLDKSVADSACSGNAIFHGVKSNYGTIGMSGFAKRSNCVDSLNLRMYTESMAKWAQSEGMATGVVTTTRITHATPACFYANSAERDWESDADVIKSCGNQKVSDIAEQLVYGEIGSKFKVIFGGGSKNFINKTHSEHGSKGVRVDGRNLIEEWKMAKETRKFIKNRSELLDLDEDDDDQVFGLFASNHMPYHLDVVDKNLQEIPSLTEMTLKAIEILENDEKGFLLVVEGGRIDHGHHDNQAKYAIDETIEFSKAIEAAMGVVDLDETLVLVTADHSHPMTYAGYAHRKHNIFGYQGKADDQKPYFTISYANGPGYEHHFSDNGRRVDPASMNISALNFQFPSTVPLKSETHSGEDVGIWASGASSYLFSGSLEQIMIPNILAYASCIGDGLKVCDKHK